MMIGKAEPFTSGSLSSIGFFEYIASRESHASLGVAFIYWEYTIKITNGFG